jgi:hypothetical protein
VTVTVAPGRLNVPRVLLLSEAPRTTRLGTVTVAAVDFGAFPSMLSGPTLRPLALQARAAAAGALFQKPNFSRPWQPRARAGSDSDADLMCIYASSEIAVHIEMVLTSAAVLGPSPSRKQRHCDSSRVPKLQPSQSVRLSEKVESTSGSAGVSRALTH